MCLDRNDELLMSFQPLHTNVVSISTTRHYDLAVKRVETTLHQATIGVWSDAPVQ
jgi:hypothetical protein